MSIVVHSLPIKALPIPFYSLEKSQLEQCSISSSLYSAESSEEESIITAEEGLYSNVESISSARERNDYPKIKLYKPQLTIDIYHYPLILPTAPKTLLNPPLTPQSQKPTPQPQPSSRLLSAFQKIYHAPVKHALRPFSDTIQPKQMSSKSASLTERIKNKFQPKKKSQINLTRSGSLSSMAKRWSSNRKKDTIDSRWSLSTHRLSRRSPLPTSPVHKAVRFSKSVSTQDTYSKKEYDRRSDPEAACVSLTPWTAQMIKEELNAYKRHEMQVHEQSKIHTHYFYLACKKILK
ncbi:hypothetical protein BY458DRAFT_478835 [Sporodiniella umbellata]|nr:hypothetical protein BY458DRAFT_478835 [Sporodiniella umbellata]